MYQKINNFIYLIFIVIIDVIIIHNIAQTYNKYLYIVFIHTYSFKLIHNV